MHKILLVEDNELNRDMLSRRLTRLGYSVIIAHDGEEGHAMAIDQRPDLIVMDVALPGIDGLEVTKLLKKNPDTRHIPIIVLTAPAVVQNREKSLAAGCDDYATKPIAFTKLSQMIASLLAQKTTAAY